MSETREPTVLRFPVVALCLLNFGFLVHNAYPVAIAIQQSAARSQGSDGTFEQGLLALQQNRPAEAVELLAAAKKRHPDDAGIRNFLGIALAATGHNSKAATEYAEAIRLAPLMEDAYRNLGFLEWNQHQLEAAAGHLLRAVQLSPQDSFAHYYLGRVYLEERRYHDAMDHLEAARGLWPDDAGFMLEAARGYAAISRPDQARKLLAHMTKLPLSEAQIAQTSSLLLQLHENASAVALLEPLSRGSAQPKSWARFDLALAELVAGEYDKAERAARQCAESLSHSPQKADTAAAWSLVGIASARAGHAEESVNAFRRAAKLAPQVEENWLNLTRELMDLSRYAEAISAVNAGLAANPKSYTLRLRLGAAHMAAGHYAEAEAVFRELVAAGDPLPTSYVGLAQVLLRVGRAQDAVTELSAARQKLGSSFLISYFLGLALDRAGRPSAALIAFNRAAQLNPRSAEAYVGVGKTELALGQAQQAIVALQNALRLAPQDVQARRLLSAAYRRAGNTQKAAEYAQTGSAAQEISPPDLIGDFFLPPWQWPREGTGN